MTSITPQLGVLATRAEYQWLANKYATMLPNPDIILERLGMDVSAYDELKYDAHIYSCIQSRKAGINSLLWEINRGGTKSDQVKFIEDLFKNLDMHRIISEMLDAPLYGFKVLEIYWGYRNGRLIPVDIVGKPHAWFFVDTNNNLRFRKYDKREGVVCPKEKFLFVQHNKTYDNPYGESLLSKCYWPYFFKKDTVKFWSTYTEKYGMPIMWGRAQFGATASQKEELANDLDNMRQDGVIVTEGEETKIELLQEARATSVDIYQSFIHFFNSEISKAILSQTLTTEQGDTGSYAMSQTHLQVRQDVVDSDKRMIEEQFNELIKYVVKLNFGELAEIPKFSLYAEEDVDMNLATRDKTLADTKQIKFTKEYFKRAYGFLDDEIDIISEQPAPAFAESDDELDSQDNIDNLKSIGINDFAKASDKLLSPVLKLIDDGLSYDEIEQRIVELMPEMDTEAIETLLAKGILVANAGGQISGLK